MEDKMATMIPRDKVFFAFSPDLQPALKVKQGEEVLLQTHDCFEGQIQTPADLVTDLDWGHVNPATGPVYIEGAKPGDVLRVTCWRCR
jgi:amidase